MGWGRAAHETVGSKHTKIVGESDNELNTCGCPSPCRAIARPLDFLVAYRAHNLPVEFVKGRSRSRVSPVLYKAHKRYESVYTTNKV